MTTPETTTDRASEPAPAPAHPRDRKRRRILHTFLQVLAVAIVVWFIARHVRHHWPALAERDWSPDWTVLALSVVMVLASLLYWATIWAAQVRLAGVRARFGRATAGALVSGLGKYLPGKVWSVLGRAYFLKQDGVPMRQAGALALLSQFSMLVADAIVGLWALPLLMGGDYAWVIPAAIATAAGGLIIMHPKLYLALVNLGLRLTGREPLDMTLSFGQVLLWILLAMTTTLTSAAAFAVLIMAFAPMNWGHVPLLVGGLALARVIGLLALFAPAGLGVREGILMLVLPAIVGGAEAAIVISLASRLWYTLAEVVGGLAGLVAIKMRR